MIIFLYGPDRHRITSYTHELRNRYRTKYDSGLNLLSFDANQPNISSALSDAC